MEQSNGTAAHINIVVSELICIYRWKDLPFKILFEFRGPPSQQLETSSEVLRTPDRVASKEPEPENGTPDPLLSAHTAKDSPRHPSDADPAPGLGSIDAPIPKPHSDGASAVTKDTKLRRRPPSLDMTKIHSNALPNSMPSPPVSVDTMDTSAAPVKLGSASTAEPTTPAAEPNTAADPIPTAEPVIK